LQQACRFQESDLPGEGEPLTLWADNTPRRVQMSDIWKWRWKSYCTACYPARLARTRYPAVWCSCTLASHLTDKQWLCLHCGGQEVTAIASHSWRQVTEQKSRFLCCDIKNNPGCQRSCIAGSPGICTWCGLRVNAWPLANVYLNFNGLPGASTG